MDYSRHTDEIQASLDELARRSDQIDLLMEDLLKEMAAVPPAGRRGDAWTTYSQRFLELSRQGEELAERLTLAEKSGGAIN